MLKQFSVNIIWYGGSQIIRSLVPFVMLPILTRYLDTTSYGVLSLIEVFILFLFPLVSINIHSAINIQFFKLNKENLNEYISNAISLSFGVFVVVSILFFILKDFISKQFKLNEILIILLPMMAVLRVYPQIILSMYQAQMKAIKYFLFTLSQSIVEFILSIVFVVILLQGYIGRLEGTYITFLIFSIISIYILTKSNLIGKFKFKYTKQILNYGVFLIPHAISGIIMAMSDRFFISYFYNNSDVGIYTVSYQLAAILLLVGVSINKAWSTYLFRMLKSNSIQITKYILSIYSVFIIFFFIILMSKNIIFDILTTDKFLEAKQYFIYLLLGFLFQIFYMIITNFLFYYEKTKVLALITFSGAMLNLILNYVLIKQIGVKGVAIATMITWIYYFCVVLIIVKNYKQWE